MDNSPELFVRPRLSIFQSRQIKKMHRASLHILAKTGVNVHSAELRALLLRAGAKTKNDLRVLIPAELVDRALETAPSRIEIADRRGDVAMVLEGTNTYFGTGSDLEFTIDHKSLQRRKSTLRDVADSARLCDRLPNMDFVMSYALPADVEPGRCELDQFRTLLDNTAKPIIMTLFSGTDCFRRLHQAACESRGGEDRFRQRPNYIMYGQFISPLQHDADALDRLIFCADHHIPIIYVPTIMMGASGPVSLAGAVALANAECLAGLVMHQLRCPGAPFIYGGCVSPLDMKTTVFVYGSPEWRLADLMLSELSQSYNLPIFGTAGATDAKLIDAQAGAEWGYSLMMAALSGTNLIHDVGYMESGLTGSLQALIICDDIVGMVKRVISGFSLDDESLASRMIHKVGPAGHFMDQEHTLLHYRKEIWYPALFDRDRFDHWQARGSQDIVKAAGERVEELLA